MSDASHHCVIVGAGHAAAQLCASLKKEGWLGQVTLIGDEPSAPYHRPPLSKTHLNPEHPEPVQLIRPLDFYASNGIQLLVGKTVRSIDRDARQVVLDGQAIAYDTLVLATGSKQRQPPVAGIDHPRVHSLYTARDAELMRDKIADAKSVVIIGAGFIGLEVASSLRKLGVDVTVLELADRVLSRVTSTEVSAYFQALHRQHGVDLRTGVSASSIEERDGRMVVATPDGTEFSADFVVVGAGSMANDQLASEAGLDVDNGVLVNEVGLTSDPSIYAMGDCCNQFHPLYEKRLRLESVQNATDQAKVVAAAIAGKPKPNAALPWFWSDQYDVKFQIAGISTGYDRCIVRGNPELGQSFSVWYFKQDRLIAVDAINDPRCYMVATKIIPTGRCPDLTLVADTTAQLKSILDSMKAT